MDNNWKNKYERRQEKQDVNDYRELEQKIETIPAIQELSDGAAAEIEEIVRNQENISDRLNSQKKRIDESLLIWKIVKDKKIPAHFRTRSIPNASQIDTIPSKEADIEPLVLPILVEDDAISGYGPTDSISSVSTSSEHKHNSSTSRPLQHPRSGRESTEKRLEYQGGGSEMDEPSSLQNNENSPSFMERNTRDPQTISNQHNLHHGNNMKRSPIITTDNTKNVGSPSPKPSTSKTQTHAHRTGDLSPSNSIHSASTSNKKRLQLSVSRALNQELRFDPDTSYDILNLSSACKSNGKTQGDLSIFRSPAVRQRHGNLNNTSFNTTVRGNMTSTNVKWVPTKLTGKYNHRFQSTEDLMVARKVYPVLYGTR